MSNTDYADLYRGIDFRKHPEKYSIGKGEQGVLLAEPYKSEILPFWKFATPEKAEESSRKIFALFEQYKRQQDFVGMDMARKFMQMGWTRSRRYANHASGRKYDDSHQVIPQDTNSETSEKAQSAAIFRIQYERIMADQEYQELVRRHRMRHSVKKDV